MAKLTSDQIDLEPYKALPSWEWPEEAPEHLLIILEDRAANEEKRLLAAHFAGEIGVINDRIARALLAIVTSPDEPEDLRGQAAIALGPALEESDTEGFEDGEFPEDAPSITQATFEEIKTTLRKLHMNPDTTPDLRRFILEAAVRAPEAWQKAAVKDGYTNGDEPSKLTALFCMRFVKGFDKEILESLKSKNPEMLFHAIQAAGAWSLRAAWPAIKPHLNPRNPDRTLLLAAIAAAGNMDHAEAHEMLSKLCNSKDDEISEAAADALSFVGLADLDDMEEEDPADEAEE